MDPTTIHQSENIDLQNTTAQSFTTLSPSKLHSTENFNVDQTNVDRSISSLMNNERITTLTKELEDSVRLIAQKELEIDTLKVNLRENLEKIQSQDRDLVQEREKTAGLENSLKETCDRLNETLRQREQEVESLKSTVAQLKDEHTNSIASIRAGEDNKARETEESIRRLEERITGLQGELAGQARNGEIVQEKEREIEDLRRQIEERGREIEQVKEQNRNLEQQLRDSTTRMEETVRSAQERHESERNQLNEVISKLEREIQEYKDVRTRLETSEAEREELVRKQRTLEEELAQVNRTLSESNSSSQQNFEELKGRFEQTQQELERERSGNQNMITEKTQEIERLQGELKTIVDEKLAETEEKVKLIEERDFLRSALEQKDTEVRNVTEEKETVIAQLNTDIENKVRELNEQRAELEQLRAKYDQLSTESGSSHSVIEEKQARIRTLEEEIRCLVQQHEEARKECQQIHEAKVLINEFAGKNEEQLVSAVRNLIEECRKSHEAHKEESMRVKDLHDEIEKHKASHSQGAETLTVEIRRLETEKGEVQRHLDQLRGEHEAHKTEMTEKVRLVEEKATKEVDDIKQGFIETIDRLQTEKDELSQTVLSTNQALEKANTDFEAMKSELTQTISRLEGEKNSFVAKMEEKESLLKASMSKETELNNLKSEHSTLLSTVSRLDEEKVKLQEKTNEYAEKLEQAMKEIAELKAQQTQKSVVVDTDNAEPKKVTIVVDEPSRDRRRSNNYWRDEQQVVYMPKEGATQETEEEMGPRARRAQSRGHFRNERENKDAPRQFDWVREKKAREEDPAYKQLQKMIFDLNEKLATSEKRAKKMIQEKVIEASKEFVQREETLLAQIEKLKEEKKELVKKMDDIQWTKAYEFTELMKVQKQEEAKAIEAALKQKQASQPAASKKKAKTGK